MFSHGYTNETTAVGTDLVTKTYGGTDAAERRSSESACLVSLADHLPVPHIVAEGRDITTLMQRLPGRHGQELIDNGDGYAVMHAAGVLLQRLQALPHRVIQPPLSGDGEVLVHGDYGPQNMLLDQHHRVTGLLDWEFAHRGSATEDVAWAEWIVRMHHPTHLAVVDGFFAGFGSRPPWPGRQAFMVERCQQLRDRCLVQRQPTDADLWEERSHITAGWQQAV
ncbi:MAG: aminoglycoside phosphotransferase family protein [Nocardioidaceae bacterium]